MLAVHNDGSGWLYVMSFAEWYFDMFVPGGCSGMPVQDDSSWMLVLEVVHDACSGWWLLDAGHDSCSGLLFQVAVHETVPDGGFRW